MAIAVLHTRLAGWIDRREGGTAATLFLFGGLLPLLPLGGRLVADGTRDPERSAPVAPLRAASVGLAYVQYYGLLLPWGLWALSLEWAEHARTWLALAAPFAASAVAGALLVYAWFGAGRRQGGSAIWRHKLAFAVALLVPLAPVAMFPAVAADHPLTLQGTCARGDAASCLRLAHCYEDGDGVAVDSGHALALKQKACQAGYAPACEDLPRGSAPGPRR